MKQLSLILSLLGSAAFADGCPVAPDFRSQMDDLIAQMQSASGDVEAQGLSNQMWGYLTVAPDEPSQAMLDEAMRARSQYDYVRALERLNALVSYCPFYAEGYNQRAFIHYLTGAYAQAVPDLEEAIKLNSKHIGALSGLALTYFALEDQEKGQAMLRRALELNPWLSERFLLTQPKGTDL